jgi:hypothetical protein
MKPNIYEISPTILTIIDREAIGISTLPDNTVVTSVKLTIRATDGRMYRCYRQSNWKGGVCSYLSFYGFAALDDEPTEPMLPVSAED